MYALVLLASLALAKPAGDAPDEAPDVSTATPVEAEAPGLIASLMPTITFEQVKVRVRPTIRPSEFPSEGETVPDARCVVSVSINERGVPYEAVPRECPEVFRSAAQDIAMRYRFYPYKEKKKGVKARFDLTISFHPPS